MHSLCGVFTLRSLEQPAPFCRTYKWIVKGGEDVRTDERMEVILDVCNGLLARHPGAASHRLKVHPGAAAYRLMEIPRDCLKGGKLDELQCGIDSETWCF